jgi:hypothetical protein
MLVYVHEIALNIEFQNIAIARETPTACLHEMISPFDAVQGAFFFTTTITIFYKLWVKDGVDVIVNQVVHYPVAKVGGNNFAFHGVVHDKAYTARDIIRPRQNVIAQLKQITLVIQLETQLIDGIALVPPRVKIGIK